METVTLNALLQVMDMETFSKLKNRGKLTIIKPAPYTEILFSSIPEHYRRKLIDVRCTDTEAGTISRDNHQQFPSSHTRNKNSEFYLRHHAPIRRLSNEGKALLQELVDERCRVITERYLEDRDKLSVEYMKDMRKPEFRAALSQYPVPYTDPRTVLYLESFDSLYQSHHDEMRRLLNICETLALKTNPHLDRVLGCNAQSHRCEPRF